MRTRFLDINFFDSAPHHAVDFFRLPLPQIPPSTLTIYERHQLFDHLSVLTISLEFHQLPINVALSTFFSQVIPDVIEDVQCSHAEIDCHRQRCSDFERKFELGTSEEEKFIVPDDEGKNYLDIVHFEKPELDLSLENAFLQGENMHIFSEVSDAEVSENMPILKLKWQNMAEILDSVFSINNITCMELKPDQLECDGTIQCSFPLLEVDETSLEICTDTPNFAKVIIKETWGPLNEIIADSKELSPHMKVDTINYLSDHCWSNQCLESDGPESTSNLVTDLVDVIEYSPIKYSVGTFEEFQYFDLTSYQFSDALAKLEIYSEEKQCENMFSNEGRRFKGFNELIVSHELTLVDDCFRSLPIPVIHDHDILLSVDTVIEETLNLVKPLCSSASEGIYLDWHILEEDNPKNGKHSFSSKRFEELETYTVELSLDDGTRAFDYIFSDDSLDELITNEKKKYLNIPNDGVSTEVIYEKPHVNEFDFFLKNGKSNTRKNLKLSPKALQPTSSTAPITLLDEQNMEELLVFVPVETSNKPDEAKSYSTELNKNHNGMPTVGDSVIIVNTDTFDREMIISRRSTYHRILAFEKEGKQVVERDLNLPVDIIINAAVCLVWYDARNIGKKATAQHEASSCLPSCVENIAANILTSVSFAFSSCILVFEGESGFLAGIMESSDELYAAAATLGINLQLFCSYSSDTTEEIISSCIRHTIQKIQGFYPKIPESEVLAESFLTLLPSINPVSAHAILSTGSILDFVECSKEVRICALQKYQVPEESITLLNASLGFGEREDSKSGTTECSSSVSSAYESDYSHFKDELEQWKRKRENQHDVDSHVDDLFHFQPLDLSPAGKSTSTRISQPVIFDASNSADMKSNGLFREKLRPDIGMMKVSDHHNFIGEVINLDDYPIRDQFSNSDSPGFFSLDHNKKKDPAREVSRTSIISDFDTYSNNTAPFKYQKMSFSDKATPQKGISNYGNTPLSQAIREPQTGSPWTIEFLNRVREKSKSCQRSLPHDLSAPCFGQMGSISKFAAKRKSPSLLDFYKYQGGSTPKRTIERKKPKSSGLPSSSSKKEKNTRSFLPTSTPNDKQARRVYGSKSDSLSSLHILHQTVLPETQHRRNKDELWNWKLPSLHLISRLFLTLVDIIGGEVC